MKAIIITKGANTDDFIPDEARATIKIDKLQPYTDSEGDATDDLFTVMHFEGIDPFIPLRNWHLGEVMSMIEIIRWAKLTKFHVEGKDGDESEVLFDPDTFTPEDRTLTVKVRLTQPAAEELTFAFLVTTTDIQGNAVGDPKMGDVAIAAGETTGETEFELTDDVLVNISARDEPAVLKPREQTEIYLDGDTTAVFTI